MIYDLVDTRVEVDLNEELKGMWEPFHSEAAEAEIHINLTQYPEDCYGLELLEIGGMSHSLKLGESVLFADQNWEKGRLYGRKTEELAPLLEMQLYSYLLTRRTLMIHSSLVDWQGKGIMFLGPSGIGKTTQAELWAKYQGAQILNGDMVFVREKKGGFYGYGSPWHGSSPYYLNSRVKVSALVVLEKGQENQLEKLEGFQALDRMMNQVFLPTWYREGMDSSLETLDRLLERVPVLHLTCRPDQEATELLRQQLAHNFIQTDG